MNKIIWLISLTLILTCLTWPLETLANNPRILDSERLDNLSTDEVYPKIESDIKEPEVKIKPALLPDNFIIKRLSIINSTLSNDAKLKLIRKWHNKPIKDDDLKTIANELKKIYKENDFALYTVVIPKQTFQKGNVILAVVEGRIKSVELTSEEGKNTGLIKEYLKILTKETPLKKSTLERQLILIKEIPGIEMKARFKGTKKPGEITLVLDIEQEAYDVALSYNNFGPDITGMGQFETKLTLYDLPINNSQTAFIYGFPDDLERYSFYGIRHKKIIGSSGASLNLSGNLLKTTPPDSDSEGKAHILSAQLIHPFKRTYKNSVLGFLSIDVLNSENAVLGQVEVSEKTRNIRSGLSISKTFEDGSKFSAQPILSMGLNGFNAKTFDRVYGDPSYIKGNLKLQYQKELIWNFSTTLSSSFQYGNGALPSSEQITYGGKQFGGGYRSSNFASDDGALGKIELRHNISNYYNSTLFPSIQAYTFLDGALLHNRDSSFLKGSANASSGGLGLRFSVLDKAVFQIQGGYPLSGRDDGFEYQDDWLLTLSLRSLF